jgi:hypothetical protein
MADGSDGVNSAGAVLITVSEDFQILCVLWKESITRLVGVNGVTKSQERTIQRRA